MRRQTVAVILGALCAACSTPSEPSIPAAGAGSSGAASAAGASGMAHAQAGSTAPPAGGTTSTTAGTSAPPSAGSAGTSSSVGGSAGMPLADAGAPPMPDASTADPETITLVPDPSWHCNLPDGIPPPASGELVFEAVLKLGTIMEVGKTQYGQRRVLPITSGTVDGAQIDGDFQGGGLEWELTTADNKVEIEARNVIRGSQGGLIYVRTCGAGAAGSNARVVFDFEAPSSGSYAFLNEGTYVATRELEPSQMRLRVFKVAAESPTAKPATLGPADQPWDCKLPDGPVGSTPVLQAAVNIGGSLAIGRSKYGSRNIIPITGGTFTGTDIMGDVISGGADFQLTPTGGSGLQIEARYTIKASDGELIVVRNCGGGGGTRLQFETRADGPHAFLNADGYTGTIGLRLGGVLISVFK